MAKPASNISRQLSNVGAWIDERILELNSRVEGQYETVR